MFHSRCYLKQRPIIFLSQFMDPLGSTQRYTLLNPLSYAFCYSILHREFEHLHLFHILELDCISNLWKWVPQSCLTLCDPMDYTVPWNSPYQNTGVCSLSLLQGIFPFQGSNPGLPHCRQILYQLSHKGTVSISNL